MKGAEAGLFFSLASALISFMVAQILYGPLTAEGFLRRIDTTHELESYEADGDMICGVA